jgi:molybdopterin synthase sulfur carrier subunit
MHITLKLFATLRDYLPEGAKSNELELDVADGTSVQGAIELYRLPSKLVHLVLVNGYYIYPNARDATRLKEGDVLALWPPVAGG